MKGNKRTPRKDYLAVVVGLSKQLSSLAEPQEQIYAYCTAMKGICSWLRRLYLFFSPKGGDRPKGVFLFDRNAQGLTILGWGALVPEERRLLKSVLDRARTRSKGGAKAIWGLEAGRARVSDEASQALEPRAVIPLASGSDQEGWVVFMAAKGKGVWDEEDVNAVSVCTDMLSASLDRARLFEKVLHAKREWERTADAIRDVVMIIDQGWTVRRGNRRLAEMGDVPVEELKGKRCFSLLASSEEPCPSCPAVVTFQTGQESTEELVRGAHGDAVFQVWSYPISDPSGNLESVAVYEKDITEYKRMQEQLVQAEKMGVLGQLASAVAHELNNPLSGVISFSQILLKETGPDAPHFEDLKNIEHAALRCKKIVEDLLAFARKPEKVAHEPVSLGELVHQAVDLFRPRLQAKEIRVESKLPRSLPKLPVHPDPLFQVLVNVISNAQDAMDVGGTLRLEARRAKKGRGEAVVLVVEDSGVGIPARNMERIFEPFFTTKGPGEGTGLGLSICQRLMESLGGSIEVSSREGKGTKVRIWFPLP